MVPLEKKVDNLNNSFKDLKKTVDYLSEKYDDVLSQLRQTNEKVHLQGTSLRHLDDVKKKSRKAIMGYENLAQYLRRDRLEISGILPGEDYTSNKFVKEVGQAIKVPIKEEDISTSHFLPPFSSDTGKF